MNEFFEIQYEWLADVENVQLSGCLSCGAVVPDREEMHALHKAWHRAMGVVGVEYE